MDEAKKKKIHVDIGALSKQLGVPVTGAAARSGRGLDELMDAVDAVTHDKATQADPVQILYAPAIEQAVALLEPPLRECCGEKNQFPLAGASAAGRRRGTDPVGAAVLRRTCFKNPCCAGAIVPSKGTVRAGGPDRASAAG